MTIKLIIRMSDDMVAFPIEAEVVDEFKEWNLANQLTYLSQQKFLYSLEDKEIYNIQDIFLMKLV